MFSSLNDEQKKAVMHTEGPVLIIAGPGTGKTFTLVKRIAFLVVQKKVAPSEIMAVTFTQKAAHELVTRVSDELLSYDPNINVNDMYIGTFHSVCLRLLHENQTNAGGKRILDGFEQTYLVCRNINNFAYLHGFRENISWYGGNWGRALEVCRYVNQLREELVDFEAMAESRSGDMRLLAKMQERYNQLLEHNSAMDFSAVQTYTYKLLVENPHILENLRNKIKFLMIDEYQDTNYIQEQLALLIAQKHKNICVVGDDDQGLYRFRGATIRNILEFPKNFENCEIIHLNKNYRSESDIVDFCKNYMQAYDWREFRYEKNITAVKNKNCNKAVYVCNGYETAEFILKLMENGNISDFNQVAVLFSSVKSSEAKELTEILERKGIPVYSPRSDMFFEREEVMLMLGCLMLCFNAYIDTLKSNSFSNPINPELHKYYIGCVKAARVRLKTDKGLFELISGFNRTISGLKDKSDISLLDIFYKIIAHEPFKTYLESDIKGNVLKNRAARNLSEISRMLGKYALLHSMYKISGENKVAMAEYLFNVYLKYMYIDGIGEYEDEAEYAPHGCVPFMTVHQAKGLEFPVVIVGSLDNIPRQKNDFLMKLAEVDYFHRLPFEPYEEMKFFDFKRLFYVAFSRAQNILVLAKNCDTKQFDLKGLPHISKFDRNTKFEHIKPVKYKHIYSFTSHIGLYDGCPRQYKFYKEYGFRQSGMFHTTVGSLIHAVLEDLNNAAINKEDVDEDWLNQRFLINCRIMRENTGYSLTEEQKSETYRQILAYYQNRKDSLNRVYKAEEKIELILSEFILQGVVDLMETDGENIEIVDYKTGTKPDLGENPKGLEHYKKQLEIYAYLIEKRYHKKVTKLSLYYTRDDDPVTELEYDRMSVEKTIKDIRRTVENIENKRFENEAQNNYACKFCDMRYVCGKG